MLKGRTAIQRDPDRLDEWVDQNLRKADKSKVLHLGGKNPLQPYQAGTNSLASRSAEKDLRILVDRKLNRSQHCDLAAKKVNSILGCINMNIAHK